MQPRLKRSATEVMVAGVCGGLAEYFNIDPVIVRLIFVLVTLTSGLGIPVYILLWIIMPKGDAVSAPQSLDAGFGHVGQEASRRGSEVLVGQQEAQSRARSGGTTAPRSTAAPEYRFDPTTGQPFGPEPPATGETMNLNLPPAELPTHYPAAGPRRARNWSTLGIILIGIGALVFLEQFGIDMSLIFPALLIVAGVILMRRKR